MPRRILTLAVATLTACSSVGAVGGNVLRVPEDYKRIQEAMRQARHGDTVLVGPGEYEGPVDVKNGVVLKSTDGPELTKIKGHRWWVVRLADSDTLTALIGFTVTGVKAADRVVFCSGGGLPRVYNNIVQKGWYGISCEGSSASVRGNVVRMNKYGIACDRASPVCSHNRITGNQIGITLTDALPKLESNVIDLNQVGIYVGGYSLPRIGGSLETANDIFDNSKCDLQNDAVVKEDGIRTLIPLLLQAEYNFWGSECPDREKFFGSVDYKPWADKEHKKKLTACPKT